MGACSQSSTSKHAEVVVICMSLLWELQLILFQEYFYRRYLLLLNSELLLNKDLSESFKLKLVLKEL